MTQAPPAAPAAQDDRLPPEVYAWRDAKLAEAAALKAFNARVLCARASDEVDGFGSTSVDDEWRTWTKAGNAAHAALKAMVGPLYDALATRTNEGTK